LPVNKSSANKGVVALANNTDSYTLTGKGFKVSINKQNGALSSYIYNNQEQIFAPLLPHFSRPVTDNDHRGWKADRKLRPWFKAVPILTNIKANKQANGSVIITSNYSLINDSAAVTVVYTVNGMGVVKVEQQLIPKVSGLPNLPKVGMQGGIKRSYNNISWYGRGLMENYIDRRSGFEAGIYSQPINDFMENYAVPQENGNRTDVRWMLLSDKQQNGLLVVADSLLSMSAWPYTEANIVAAKHTNKLKDAGFITMNIDLIQMGLGGNDSWSDVAAPLDIYQIPAKPYSYSFYLYPYKGSVSSVKSVVSKVKN